MAWRLGQLLGCLLRPLTLPGNLLLRRGLIVHAVAVTALVLGLSALVVGLGLLMLSPSFPALLMAVAGLVGGVLAVLGKLCAGAVFITFPVWLVGGFFLRKPTGPAAVQR